MRKVFSASGIGVALVLTLCASVQAQETKPSSDLWTMLMAGPEENAVEQGRSVGPRGKDQSFMVGLKMEQWQAVMEVTGVSETPPDPINEAYLEDALDIEVLHSVAFLVGEYVNQMPGGTIRGHLGLGFERMGMRILDDDPIGGENHFDDFVFDQSFIFEIGGGYTHFFQQADVAFSVLYRSGDADRDIAIAGFPDITEEYEYTLFRLALEVGYRAQEGVRPFFGMRYSMYESTWTETYPLGFGELEIEMEMDQPFGVSVGVDVDAGVVSGRFELMFVDVEDVGFAVSAGVKF